MASNKSIKKTYPNLSQLKLRPLTEFDARQFQSVVLESKDSISTFLDLGIEISKLGFLDFKRFYSRLISDKNSQHFGVFHGYKMLAYAYFCSAFHSEGIQIVYWVREEYLRQNIGTWTIGNMTTKAFLEYEYQFSQLVIDKANYASRRIAKIMGYTPLISVKNEGQGNKASGTFITYVRLNPALNMKAAANNMRPIDLIGHFAFIKGLEHLISDEKVNDYFKWKFPIYVEDDLNPDGTFKNWKPEIDPLDPTTDIIKGLKEKYPLVPISKTGS